MSWVTTAEELRKIDVKEDSPQHPEGDPKIQGIHFLVEERFPKTLAANGETQGPDYRRGKKGGDEEEAGGRRALGIEHKWRGVLFSGLVESLMFEEKGDRPHAHEDLHADGLPDVCGRVRREGTHGLSKRDAAADGLEGLRDAGKRIEVLDGRNSGHRRAEQEDPGNALPGIRAAGRSRGLPDSPERRQAPRAAAARRNGATPDPC